MSKQPYAAGHPLVAGETVTAGSYTCKACGDEIEIQGVENLPLCPRCLGDEWDPS